MKKTLEVIKQILKWFNCWQSYSCIIVLSILLFFFEEFIDFGQTLSHEPNMEWNYFIKMLFFHCMLYWIIGFIHKDKFGEKINGLNFISSKGNRQFSSKVPGTIISFVVILFLGKLLWMIYLVPAAVIIFVPHYF